MSAAATAWSDDAIVDLIRRALATVAPERAERFRAVTLATRVEELDLDSIAIVEMVGVVEDELGRPFPGHQIAAVRSLHDIAELIRKESADGPA